MSVETSEYNRSQLHIAFILAYSIAITTQAGVLFNFARQKL